MSDRTRLAVAGGAPARTQPFPSRRVFGPEERQAAIALFDAADEQGDRLLGYAGAQEEE